jgi:hypothetical protein
MTSACEYLAVVFFAAVIVLIVVAAMWKHRRPFTWRVPQMRPMGPISATEIEAPQERISFSGALYLRDAASQARALPARFREVHSIAYRMCPAL